MPPPRPLQQQLRTQAPQQSEGGAGLFGFASEGCFSGSSDDARPAGGSCVVVGKGAHTASAPAAVEERCQGELQSAVPPGGERAASSGSSSGWAPDTESESDGEGSDDGDEANLRSGKDRGGICVRVGSGAAAAAAAPIGKQINKGRAVRVAAGAAAPTDDRATAAVPDVAADPGIVSPGQDEPEAKGGAGGSGRKRRKDGAAVGELPFMLPAGKWRMCR